MEEISVVGSGERVRYRQKLMTGKKQSETLLGLPREKRRLNRNSDRGINRPALGKG